MTSRLQKKANSSSASELDDEIADLENECESLLKKHKERKREKKESEKLERAVGSGELQKPQRDKEGNAVFELNSKKKVRVSKFKGQVLIDFREYWQTPTGETMPTKKGVSLTLDAYNQLKALIPSIDAQIN